MELLMDEKLFWEADLTTLNPIKHKQYIIERVFDKGTWNDIKEIAKFYSIDEIKFALQWARWFDIKTIHFISVYFDIPLEKMRSYRQRQDSPPLWV
jgi:hypothetical protein